MKKSKEREFKDDDQENFLKSDLDKSNNKMERVSFDSSLQVKSAKQKKIRII